MLVEEVSIKLVVGSDGSNDVVCSKIEILIDCGGLPGTEKSSLCP